MHISPTLAVLLTLKFSALTWSQGAPPGTSVEGLRSKLWEGSIWVLRKSLKKEELHQD